MFEIALRRLKRDIIEFANLVNYPQVFYRKLREYVKIMKIAKKWHETVIYNFGSDFRFIFVPV